MVCESCHDTGYYSHENDEYKCYCWVSDAAVARVLHARLKVLAGNLKIAAMLCRAWALGNDVDCAFRNNWEPGCRENAPDVTVCL